MKYLVTGADRDTGEDIEMSIEATSIADASAKANRRRILVAGCRPANGETKPFAAKATPRVSERNSPKPQTESRYSIWLKSLAIFFVIFTVFFFVFLKPEHDRAVEEGREASKSLSLMDKLDRQSNEQARLDELRRLSDPNRSDVDTKPTPTKQTAMDADPLISHILDLNPGLSLLIKQDDPHYLKHATDDMIRNNQISSEDADFVMKFADAISGCP